MPHCSALIGDFYVTDDLQTVPGIEPVRVQEFRAVPTLDSYMTTDLLPRRKQLQPASVDDDETRYRLHIGPRLGTRRLDEVRPRDIRQLILALRQQGKLAPRTILHVYNLLSAIFKSAVADELILATPVVVPRGTLPPNIDRDPEWRATAIYSRAEVEALIGDPRIIGWRRVLYALKFLAALRHSEAARLRWDQIAKREPLDGILLGKTKSKTPRQIPIHPTLAWILSDWRLHGFVELMGRNANPTDLVVPTIHGTPRSRNNCQRALLQDLARLGWRRRRGHDLRRTLITFAREDGSRDEVLRAITHGPRRDVQEQYTSWSWQTLCMEMGKVRVTLGRGIQLSLHLQASCHVESPSEVGWAKGLEPSTPGATVRCSAQAEFQFDKLTRKTRTA